MDSSDNKYHLNKPPTYPPINPSGALPTGLYFRFQPLSYDRRTGYAYTAGTEQPQPISPIVSHKQHVLRPENNIIDNTLCTPQGKTDLQPTAVLANFESPTSKQLKKIVRYSPNGKMNGDSQLDQDKACEDFISTLAEKGDDTDLFRGGIFKGLTNADVIYRSAGHAGHRSRFAKPGVVMGMPAAQAAKNAGLYQTGDRWEWGHLFPAGGTPKGIEPNKDEKNFVAIKAGVNTWQMVPETIARFFAKSGRPVDYQVHAKMKQDDNSKALLLADELYYKLTIEGIPSSLEFYTQVDNVKLPTAVDAAHVLIGFCKAMNIDFDKKKIQEFKADFAAALKEAEEAEEAEMDEPQIEMVVEEEKVTKKRRFKK